MECVSKWTINTIYSFQISKYYIFSIECFGTKAKKDKFTNTVCVQSGRNFKIINQKKTLFLKNPIETQRKKKKQLILSVKKRTQVIKLASPIRYCTWIDIFWYWLCPNRKVSEQFKFILSFLLLSPIFSYYFQNGIVIH